MASSAQRLLLALGLLATLAGVSFGIHYAFQFNGRRADKQPPADNATARGKLPRPDPLLTLFRDGPTPDLVLMLSGPMYSYLQPCGCARPQTGGLERRYELLRRLRARGWAISAADLGDLAAKQMNEQARTKYETALQILQQMDYAAVGLGLTELGMPLEHALALAQNWQPPAIVAANLDDKENRFPEMFRGWTLHEPRRHHDEAAALGRLLGVFAGPPFRTPASAAAAPLSGRLRVAYVGLISDQVAAKAKARDATLAFQPVAQALPAVLEQVESRRPDVLVLLFQGLLEEARQIARQYPQFHVILAQDEYDTPTAAPKPEGKTLVIGLGSENKGKYVGLVGITRHPDQAGLDLRFRLLELSEQFELPDAETNPARELMKDYVLQVYQRDFLGKWPRGTHPVQLQFPEARYVGAEACKDCHKNAYAVWSSSRHSHAYEALIEHGKPVARRERKGAAPVLIGRQYDPECVTCHTTGFNFHGGFLDAQKTPHLRGNGCENCHGPASLHVASPKESKYYLPLRLRAGQVEYDICRKCHDGDNDPHFNWDVYWPKIRHGRD
jgi:hypothetical protein